MLSNIASLATLLVASHALGISSEAKYEYENTDGVYNNALATDSLDGDFAENLWNTMDTNKDGVVGKEKFIATMNLNMAAIEKWIYAPATDYLNAAENVNGDP